ncbi:MAG: sel1 repeat family protein, partial [Nitrospinota bacterium]|nr:sel1 repeat family protein [Nitrospinota bacterium]
MMKVAVVKLLFRSCLLAGMFFMSHPPATLAEDYDDAMEAIRQGDHHTAYDLLIPMARNGDVRAQNNLGVMIQNGYGGKKGMEEAIEWFHMAAQSNYAVAQYNLGMIYAKGEGTAQNYVMAASWFEKAARQG